MIKTTNVIYVNTLPVILADSTLYLVNSDQTNLFNLYITAKNYKQDKISLYEVAQNASVFFTKLNYDNNWLLKIVGTLYSEIVNLSFKVEKKFPLPPRACFNSIKLFTNIAARDSLVPDPNWLAIVLDASADSRTNKPIGMYAYTSRYVLLDELTDLSLTVEWIIKSTPLRLVDNTDYLINILPINNVVNLDLDNGNYGVIVTTNLTININVPPPPICKSVTLLLTMNNIGGHTITLPNNLYTDYGIIPELDTSPNVTSTLVFWTDGLGRLNFNVYTGQLSV